MDIIQSAGLNSHVDLKTYFLTKSEMSDLIYSHDIMLLPYRDIDQSGIFMTSMGSNIPCLCSEIGIFSELIKHESNGFLFPSESVEALSITLMDLIRNPNKIHKAKLNFQSDKIRWLSWNEIGIQTFSAYQSAK